MFRNKFKVLLDVICNLSGKPFPKSFTEFKVKVIIYLSFNSCNSENSAGCCISIPR